MNRILVYLICLAAGIACAQMPDSTAVAPIDTTYRTDTLRLRFISGLGDLTRQTDTTSPLQYRAFAMADHKTAGDVLSKEPGIYIRELGESGKPLQWFFHGIDDRGIAVLVDGRPMNDPLTGRYNLSFLPIDALEGLELVGGASSASLASNNSGRVLNAVSRQYNSFRPITRIRYVQEPQENILTDGLFTQNVARGTNLTAGFTRQVSTGRYINSGLNAWNVRFRLRSNVSERVNASISYAYTKANNGMHSGIDPVITSGMFDEKLAALLTETANDSYYRYDWTIHSIARLTPDTSVLTHAVIYFSSIQQIYDERGDGLVRPFTVDHLRDYGGLRVQQDIPLTWIDVRAGLQWERRVASGTKLPAGLSESLTALFASASLPFGPDVKASFHGRFESLRGMAGTTAGLRIDAGTGTGLSLFVEGITGGRFPTIQESRWNDSTFHSTVGGRERFMELRAGTGLRLGSGFDLQASAFHRTTNDAITASADTLAYPAIRISQIPEMVLTGFTGDARIRLWRVELRGTATAVTRTEQGRTVTIAPDYILLGEAAYVNSHLNGALDVRAGVRSRIVNRQQGTQMFPAAELFYESTAGMLGRHYVMDFFGVVRIGQANISLTWENVTATQYVQTAVYPMPGRQMKLGINWRFED